METQTTKLLIFLFGTILFLNLISASVVISYPNPIPSTIILNSSSISQVIEFTNTNSSQNIDLTFSLSPSLNGLVTLSKTSLNIGVSPYKGSVMLTIPETYESGGTFNGYLAYSYNGENYYLPLKVIVAEEINIDEKIIIFPTSKVVTVQQGSSKTQSISITVPSTYPRPITIQSVDFNPGTETIIFGDLNLGVISPGNSLSIPIVFSGEDAQTGTYETDLSILAIDSEGQVSLPDVHLKLQVTSGISAITDDTFSTSPTCAISATTLNLNNTYSFTCSGVFSNLEVNIPSSDFYIGKGVDITSSIYTYTFTPVKYGQTEFVAEFKYNGASIFTPFKQDVLITSAGSILAGTTLKLVFTPSLNEEAEYYFIQLVDNKTGSLVEGPKLFIDAVEIDTTSDYTFKYVFESGKNYSIRGKANGYEDLMENVAINSSVINVTINPASGDTSTMFNITTSVENTTIVIQGSEYLGSYYGVLPGGDINITFKKTGYITKVLNMTIEERYRVSSYIGEFKKDILQNLTLNRAGEWVVYYAKSLDSIDRSEYARGEGLYVSFTPKKTGVYTLEVEGTHVTTYQIEGFSFSNKLWFMPIWGWLITIIVIIVAFWLIKSGSSSHTSSADGGGLSFAVGDY